MADNDDKPAAGDKPTPRRRAPRKATPKAESAKSAPAKPAPAKRRAPAKKAAPKPPAAPAAPSASAGGGKSRDSSRLDRVTDAVGGKRNAAAIAGGLAAVGAAAAALLSLRSSSAKNKGPSPVQPGAKAHQPDGTDSSASFEAGIADENTIPDTKPA